MLSNLRIKTFLKGLLFLLIFIFCTNIFTKIFCNKEAYAQMGNYSNEEPNSIDVILLGASPIDWGISAMTLWHEQGITAYNISMGGHTIPMSYYNLKMALEHQSPQVVVFDIGLLFCEEKIYKGQKELLHQLLEYTAPSFVKLEAVVDLVEPELWAEFIFPISLYKERWSSLKEEDFSPPYSGQKGGRTYFRTVKKSEIKNELYICSEEQKVDVEDNYPEAMSYVYKIVELCREKNIALIFVNIPSYAIGETKFGDGIELQKMWNGFADYAKKENIDYINYMHILDEINFVFDEDMADWRHPNYWGQQKLTIYLGEYIRSNYNIIDQRNNCDYSFWHKDYEVYINEIAELCSNER